MSLKDLLEFGPRLGQWAPLFAGLWLLWLIWKRPDWNSEGLRQRVLNWSIWHRIVASAIVLILCGGGWFHFHRNRGLPERFADGVIGILIAPVSTPEEQQLYQHRIQAALRAFPELDRRVAVALLERGLPPDEEEAHQTALELGRRINAAFVLRAIRVGFGGTTQHQIWLTVVDQPDVPARGSRLDMGTLMESDLADLEKLQLPSDVMLLARSVLAMTLYRAESYRQAADHFAAILGEPEIAGVPARFDLLFSYGGAQYHNGAYREAASLYRQALELRKDDKAGLHNLALALLSAGDYAEAEPLLRRVLRISEETLGPQHPETATNLNDLAGLYLDRGRYDEAEALLQRAIAIREKTLGPKHPDTAASLDNLAGLYITQGRYGEAEPLQERALTLFEKSLGAEHPRTVASLNNLAARYAAQGRYAEAEPTLQRVLTIQENALGPEHPTTAGSLYNLAGLYRAQSRYAEAELLLRRVLTIRENALGPEHPYTAASLRSLAGIYGDQDRYAEAEPLLQRAIAIQEKALGPTHPDTTASLDSLALLYSAQGRHAEAELLWQRILAIQQ